jgi:hypothetical protein
LLILRGARVQQSRRRDIAASRQARERHPAQPVAQRAADRNTLSERGVWESSDCEIAEQQLEVAPQQGGGL